MRNNTNDYLMLSQKQANEVSGESLCMMQGHQKDDIWAYTLPPGNMESSWQCSERVLKDGDMYSARISSAQHTLKFGLLCITIMYFRAKYLLKKKHNIMFQLRWKDESFPRLHPLVSRCSRSGDVQAGARRIEVIDEKIIHRVLLTKFRQPL